MPDKTFGLALAVDAQNVSTVPDGSVWTVAMLQIANVTADASEIDVTISRVAADGTVTRLCFNRTIEPGDSLSPVIGSLSLMPGDSVAASASVADGAELLMTVIEGAA